MVLDYSDRKKLLGARCSHLVCFHFIESSIKNKALLYIQVLSCLAWL